MKLSGAHRFEGDPQAVYGRLLDPDVLRRCMPGCERLEEVGDGRFELAFSVPVPAIKGQYTGTVEILDQAPPSSFRMKIEATGKSGFVNADAVMRIVADDAGSTVHYEAEAQVGGPAASVGQRVLTGISRRQVDQMMRCLNRSAAPKPGLFARLRAWLRARRQRRLTGSNA
jgi:carbon monoxide dehydrogenase subunit G